MDWIRNVVKESRLHIPRYGIIASDRSGAVANWRSGDKVHHYY